MEIINKVRKLGVKVSLKGDSIDIKAPKGVLNQELIDEIKNNKINIISYLSKKERIKKASIAENYPLTSSQERFWILSQQSKVSTAYNIPICVKFIGEIDLVALNESVKFLINRYEILRTGFILDSYDKPVQIIKDFSEIDFEIKYLDYTDPNNDSENLIENILYSDSLKNFDLSDAPLIRCTLIKKDDFEHIFLVVFHHIISDGWSVQIFINELSLVYDAILKNHKPHLSELSIQYKDYAVWKNFYKENNTKILQKYWLDKMSGEIPVLTLSSYPRPKVKTYNGDSISCNFNKEVKNLVSDFVKNQEVSAFMVFSTVLKILLHKYSGQNDIILGTPTSGRDNHDIENQIGLFLNTLVLRSQIDKNQTFIEALLEEKKSLLEAYENQDYPFEELVENLNLARDTSRSPLFDILIVYNSLIVKQDIEPNNGINLKIEPYNLDAKKAKFDFTFTFVENDSYSLNVIYNTDIYEKVFVEQILKHYQYILLECLRNSNKKIKDLIFLSKEDENKLLQKNNLNFIDNSKGKTIFELFKEQCISKLDKNALVSSSKTISYEALLNRVISISNFLIEKGVEKGDRVIICYKLDVIDAITSMLAIWRINAVYVPVEYDIATERLQFIIEDTKSKLLLSKGIEFDDSNKEFSIEIINTDSIETHNEIDKLNDSHEYLINDDAYIIYTSGSTGTPKGVLVSHKNILDYLYGIDSTISISRFNSFAMMSTISTDLGNTVLYPSLAFGKTLHVFNKNELRDKIFIQDYFENNCIECIKIVPSFWNALSFDDVVKSPSRMIIFGGEELDVATTNKIFSTKENDFEIINHYGPTETTIGKLLHRVNRSLTYDKIPLGNVFSNTSAIVVDEDFNLCPYEVEGELLIGGDGVSKGYINNEDMNSEKFITDKFLEISKRWYKTGDRVIRKFTNDIQFLGRKDTQVKIMGHRIELSEIDAVLQLFPSVESSVTVVIETESAHKKLHTFYVPKKDINVDILELSNFAKSKLPFYSIPLSYQSIDLIPFSSNGKIDYKSLFEKIEKNISLVNTYIAPRNELESKICSIWTEVLKVERVGITDNFFDLGGDSLMVIQIINKIRKELNVVITVEDVYNYNSISAILSNSDSTSTLYFNEQNHDDTIYFIPPILGSSILFSSFVKEVANRFNCIGFSYKGSDKRDTFYKSIQEIADDFYVKILKNENKGKIILFTYSMGGLIGFELLKKLEATFFDKEFVFVILDKAIINDQPHQKVFDSLKNIDKEIEKYFEMTNINDLSERNHFKEFILNNLKISNNYSPEGFIKSKMYIFESNNNKKFNMKSWEKYTRGEVEYIKIKGSHWEAMNPENWEYYSKIINKNSQKKVINHEK